MYNLGGHMTQLAEIPRARFVLAISFGLGAAAIAGTTDTTTTLQKAARTAQPAPIAVVELFTSEACPSCPDADRFLGHLDNEARASGKNIFPLAFHVDYWSPPSRRDPLSATEYHERQRDYVESMGLDGAYTPQMIVNGTTEFVGSERETARRMIEAALSRAATVNVRLDGVRRERDGRVTVDVNVGSVPRGAVLNVAVVERGLKPRGGAGVSSYANVVRSFETVRLSSGGKQTVQLTPPATVVPANCSIIAYVQENSSMAVLGAAAKDLQPPPVTAGQVLNQPRQ
jgi:hypothetical protein